MNLRIKGSTTFRNDDEKIFKVVIFLMIMNVNILKSA